MAELIDRWSDDSMQLVAAAAHYAKTGVFDDNADANIRQVRIMCQILLTAANQASSVQRPPENPPPPEQ